MMKQIFTLLTILSFSVGLWAQSAEEVTTGPSYAMETYYSFENGSLNTSARDNWDVAFAVARFDVSILANNGAGVELYTYPNGDTSSWNHMDTLGMSNWTPMNNSIEDLNNGAFLRNIDTSNDFDQGWGVYNMTTHIIEGDSLFILKSTAGNYKKVWVVNTNPNMGANYWTFKYADLDGGNEETVVIEADNYQGLNHIHYSIENNMVVEKEPQSADWQLYFTRYYDYNIPYYVTGVQINSSYVQVQQVDEVDQNNYTYFKEAQFSSNLSEIGSDWKEFNMGTFSYDINDNRVFFCKVYNEAMTDSTYWKLYFTDFGGSADGNYYFTQQDVTDYLSTQDVSELALFEVYPNPSSQQLNIITDAQIGVDMMITDMTGKIVYRGSLRSGFNQERINVSAFEAGVYNISLSSDNGIVNKKFIKQ